jgi:hypothetical protein
LQAGEPYRVIFPPDPRFNCIAHAAGANDRWWWPLPYPSPPGLYWPPQVPRVESVDAFVQAFAIRGYAKGGADGLEPNVEKVAIYAKHGKPAHAALQLDTGLWTSKIGIWEVIEHTLIGLTGNGPNEYGDVVEILSRPRP